MEIMYVNGTPARDDKPLVLVIGKLDGIHKGHQALLNAAAKQKGPEESLAVWTFKQHPLWVLKEDIRFKGSLLPEKEQMEVLEQFGVERVYQVDFTKDYAAISAETFIMEHLSQLNIKRIVVGEDFRFGAGRESGTDDLIDLCSNLNIAVTVVPVIKENGRKISSTKIREWIADGKMESVQAVLGKPYSITGTVVHGEALGRKLGFPTINMGGIEEYVTPKPGLYLGSAEIHHSPDHKEYWNVLINAGFSPTVGGRVYRLEAYLIDFSGDLYDKMVSIHFLRFLRDEIKFDNLDLLVAQMNEDKAEAKLILE
ncbi:bifunctional riboflavin kinase/FAD synthetase [Bacillus salacetis]|uniref:bifunctional riboflavin kinase/FAD synthetase n=1 Tax=Bacillus salacetis TaxID=2315464 RepID=UPI003BA2B1B7